MKYAQGFWVVRDGRRILDRVSPFAYPATRGFEYADGTGDRGDFLLEPFTVFYRISGGPLVRMTVLGDPNPVLRHNAFDFDWASVPKALRWAACDKADYRIRVASLFHDILFCVHHELFPLAQTNRLLAEIMEAYSDGTFGDWRLRRKVYAAVCAGGRFCWDKTPEELAIYRKLFNLEIVPV